MTKEIEFEIGEVECLNCGSKKYIEVHTSNESKYCLLVNCSKCGAEYKAKVKTIVVEGDKR